MTTDRTAPPEKDPELSAATHALKYAYGPVLSKLRRDPTLGKLGIKPPSYARGFVRNHAVVMQLCTELSEYWWRIAQYNAKSSGSDWKRAEARHREDSALELIDIVRTFPAPVRQVVEMRAMGMSWKDISRMLPDRAIWSMTDDWRSACRMLVERHDDLVRRVN